MGGIVDAVGGILGGGSSGPSQPNVQVYQPGGTPTQDTNLQNLLTQNTTALSGTNNPYSQYMPQIIQAFSQLFSTPGTAGYNTAANASGAASNTVGTGGVNLSNLLQTAAPQALTAGSQVLNTAMDPQQALYNQQFQQTNDQANVTNAQYGLTGQQAAENTNTADSNFNINWQNNELARQLSGLQGYDQTLTGVGTAGTSAGNVGTQGAANILAGGATPYSAGQTIGGSQETALTQLLSQLLGPSTSTAGTIGQLQNYLNTGVSASAQGADAALQDYYAQMQNSANAGSALGGIADFITPGASGSSGAGNLISGIGSLASLF